MNLSLVQKKYYNCINHDNVFWKQYYKLYFNENISNVDDAKRMFIVKYKYFNLKTQIPIGRHHLLGHVDLLDSSLNLYKQTRQFDYLHKCIVSTIYYKIGFNVIDGIYFDCARKCSRNKGAAVKIIVKLSENDRDGDFELCIYNTLMSLENNFISLVNCNKILLDIVPYVNIRFNGIFSKTVLNFRLFNANEK